ncbi:MAG: MazG nucleotide pyrophosphohydrolase [Candidatus Magasanikbacteria bacterium GW2011_GWA2_56_11]|uniref:MazG nucleotide pyrophosphohydrolase n=1 Tax=Candidatus Magasanikbacteria bacterium GW2011_GWA2_56_11 TaxID=1619044 RepID=A0A0G1YI42_9BACT|nr:MAG: MazG nucleotide pyrophosphohydrolase [Candidatus Magasanikbacteria bacterium GW2011_GWA2_56_11]
MKSVVVCGSKKYKDEIKEFCRALEEAGVLVYEPNVQSPIPEDSFFHSEHVTRMIFKGLTLEHFDWIRKADVCFVYNKDSYAGVSVTLEMGYAAALGKPIFALSTKTGDPCRDTLIDKVVPDAETLIRLLN